MLIKTRYRSKLGKEFSYPIGAELLDAGLGDVSQAEALDIAFRARPTTFASEFRRLIEKGRPYPILSATFTRWDKRPSLGDEAWVQEYLAGRWSLEVYPVPRKDKAVAKRHLIDTGIPALRKWLAAPRPSSWYFGTKRCQILFSVLDRSVSINEVTEAA